MHRLPLEMFDRTTPLRPLRRGVDVRSQRGTTWALEIDGRPVPFKFLCHNPDVPRPVLLALPGMGLTPVTFHGVGADLFATHDLLLVDYPSLWIPGAWPQEGVSLHVLAHTLWRIVAALDLREVAILGSSLGGGLALVAALRAPPGYRVSKLLLLNPACYPQELPRLYKMFRFPLLGEVLTHTVSGEKLLRGLERIGYVNPTRVPRELHACYARHLDTQPGRATLMALIRQLPAGAYEIAPHVRRLGEISTPALVVWGVQDKLLLPGMGRRLADDLPYATYVEFADLSHMPHEEAPERVGPVLAKFLAGAAHDPACVVADSGAPMTSESIIRRAAAGSATFSGQSATSW